MARPCRIMLFANKQMWLPLFKTCWISGPSSKRQLDLCCCSLQNNVEKLYWKEKQNLFFLYSCNFLSTTMLLMQDMLYSIEVIVCWLVQSTHHSSQLLNFKKIFSPWAGFVVVANWLLLSMNLCSFVFMFPFPLALNAVSLSLRNGRDARISLTNHQKKEKKKDQRG